MLWSCVDETYPRVPKPRIVDLTSVSFPADVLNTEVFMSVSRPATVLMSWGEDKYPCEPRFRKELRSCDELI